MYSISFFCQKHILTLHVCSHTDTPRSRRERRARQRDFIKAQENGIMQEGRNRLSIASTSSTSTCSSVGSGQVPADTALQDSKYSSLSSLSDTESLGKNISIAVFVTWVIFALEINLSKKKKKKREREREREKDKYLKTLKSCDLQLCRVCKCT